MSQKTIKRVLLVEPPGGFIRLDRCMQRNDSWGGVFRFPLNLCRIAASMKGGFMPDSEVRFIDLQADPNADLEKTLLEFKPELCILSCGFPSMHHDSECAGLIKKILPSTHVSTFGVVPTALGLKFFEEKTWGFPIHFDSIVTGGEPTYAYAQAMFHGVKYLSQKHHFLGGKIKNIWTLRGRELFNPELYRSPFNGEIQTYVEGSYGCPKDCNFCVVGVLYGGKFLKRFVKDILIEFEFVLERNGVKQISLWDEGTTFQRTQIKEICEGLIKLRESNPLFQNFTWNTRSTTALIDKEIALLMKRSGVSGLTLGLESFDQTVLKSTGKGTTVEDNLRAIEILKEVGIISIGHIVLGLPQETRKSAEVTIQGAIDSGLDIAQFYCAVPYPGTELHKEATKKKLIQVHDLAQYELCNPIMDTEAGLTFTEVGELRKEAMHRFYAQRDLNLNLLKSDQFKEWANR